MSKARRRGLLGVALATMAGGVAAAGIVSGVATAAADVAETANPDAELIRLCTAFSETELCFQNEADTPGGLSDDEVDNAYFAARDAQRPLLDRVTECEPNNLAGFAAVARSLLLWSGKSEWNETNNTDDRLASMLVHGLAERA